MGYIYKVAAGALAGPEKELEKVADKLHDAMIEAVNREPYSNLRHLWVPRLSVKISLTLFTHHTVCT